MIAQDHFVHEMERLTTENRRLTERVAELERAVAATTPRLDHPIAQMMGAVKLRGDWREDFLRRFDHLDGSDRARTYHGLAHLRDLWQCDPMIEARCLNEAASAAFVLYHDSVYASPSSPGFNEEQSAQFFMENLRIGAARLPVDTAIVMRNGIIATKRHTVMQDLPAIVEYWMDADLWGLGGTAWQYDANTEAVRAETGLDEDDPAWIQGRRAFLHAVLSRDRAYYTRHRLVASRVREEHARINMHVELHRLETRS